MWPGAEAGKSSRVRWPRVALGVAALGVLAPMLMPPAWLGMDRTGPEALAARLARGDPGVLVVDVRTRTEFRHGHIPGALSVPLHLLVFRLRDLAAARDREVVLVCLTGHRSRAAGLVLRAAGLSRLTNLSGGMAAWRARGLDEA